MKFAVFESPHYKKLGYDFVYKSSVMLEETMQYTVSCMWE